MFNFFKKDKEPKYDPTNITVKDLEKGFVFEYDLRTWEVQEAYTYDWGDEFFSREYKVYDGSETRFLSVEEDDKLELSWHEKIKLSMLSVDIEREITENSRPPKAIVFQGITFYRDEESPGYFNSGDNDAWVEMIAWDYYDEEDEYELSIEQWEERSFEASFGKSLEEFEVSNILPGEST